MKKFLPCLLISSLSLLFFAGCKGRDRFLRVSELKSDLFCAETEEFTLTVSCCEREYPYCDDGIVSPATRTLEAVLSEKQPSGAEYELYFLEDVPRGGDMSYRSVTGDYFYSRNAETFPEGSVSLRVVKDGAAQDLLATSVKTERTISPQRALESAVAAEKETVERLDEAGGGEYRVRLLRRDKTYYYVGMVDGAGGTLSLLLDGETGEVLARRERR